MAFCDGENAVLLPPARDYKRAFDGDNGPNTGGMGSYSPLPDVSDDTLAEIKARIIMPTLLGMAERGTPYHGLLYAGIMLTKDGPMLLEYNVRFGDPETQVVLARIESDITEYMLACGERGGLAKLGPLQVKNDAAVCIVLASSGYPGKCKTGYPISGTEDVPEGVLDFHAGTNRTSDAELVTSGGRVMSIVGIRPTIEQARVHAGLGADAISFENKVRRSDIAFNVA
jgi:phosphoribosylamine--glycine ligase